MRRGLPVHPDRPSLSGRVPVEVQHVVRGLPVHPDRPSLSGHQCSDPHAARCGRGLPVHPDRPSLSGSCADGSHP